MKTKKLFSYFVCLACFASCPVFADQALILPPGSLNAAQLLPPPPPDNSPLAGAERAYIKTAYADATPKQREAARLDAANENVRLYADTLPGFDLNKLPATAALFKIVRTNEAVQTGAFKMYFNRQRPYQVDSSITPCLPPKNYDINASDPSGHTSMAFSSAIILANLLPDYATAIMRRAEQYGRHRIICGAHHPFDVRSGQVLGTIIGEKLLQSPELQPQLEAARTELNQAIAKPMPLRGTEWVASRLNGEPIENNAPTLTVKGNQGSGNSGCNRYTSEVTIGSKDAIKFSPPASTKMACTSSTDQQESAYFKTLQNATEYHLNHDSLILLDNQYNKIIEFKAVR